MDNNQFMELIKLAQQSGHGAFVLILIKLLSCPIEFMAFLGVAGFIANKIIQVVNAHSSFLTRAEYVLGRSLYYTSDQKRALDILANHKGEY